MPERWFCWFDNYSTTVNRGVSIFYVYVCKCVEIALSSMSMCESEGEGVSVTEKACGEDKARGCACLFHTEGDTSQFWFQECFSIYFDVFFFPST